MHSRNSETYYDKEPWDHEILGITFVLFSSFSAEKPFKAQTK